MDPIICAECGCANAPDNELCAGCNHHLHIICAHCRAENLRGSKYCAACGVQFRRRHSPAGHYRPVPAPPRANDLRAALAAFAVAAVILAAPFLFHLAAIRHQQQLDDLEYQRYLESQEAQKGQPPDIRRPGVLDPSTDPLPR